MPSTTQLARLDACAQADLVRVGELSPSELVEAAIARIEDVDGGVNAVTIPLYEQARRAAAALGEDRSGPHAPLRGVPLLLKDLGPTAANSPTTLGSRMLNGFVAKQEGELVRRFRQAGMVVLGKTNSAEFGVLPTTEPEYWGPTRNPWHPDHSTGGSSGGAAAAVACGLVPVAHANDAGGSIRIPAACCGVFGIKPTRARTPMGPSVGDLMNGLAVEFIVSRSVRDSAAVLDLVAGPDLGDPYVAPPHDESYVQAQRRRRRLRIGVDLSQEGTGSIHSECMESVRRAIELCVSLGHQVEEIKPPVTPEEVKDDFLVLWAAGVSFAVRAHAQLSGRRPCAEVLEPLTFYLLEQGQRLSAADYLGAVARLQARARSIAHAQSRFDATLGPVTRTPPPTLGYFQHQNPQTQLDLAYDFALSTPLANLTGQPAMSVPMGWTAEGLPCAVQFSGRYGEEGTLFELASQLEEACPWAEDLPPLAKGHPNPGSASHSRALGGTHS